MIGVFACGACTGAGAGRSDVDAEVRVERFCEGVPTAAELGALTAPYVTFDDGVADACVFTDGSSMGAGCPDQLASGSIELGCPWTSVLFDMYQRPTFRRQLFVQSAYAFLARGGERPQSGNVVEMVIDSSEGNTISGHYRAEFPPADRYPAVQARGTFSMCVATGVLPFDPCRQM